MEIKISDEDIKIIAQKVNAEINSKVDELIQKVEKLQKSLREEFISKNDFDPEDNNFLTRDDFDPDQYNMDDFVTRDDFDPDDYVLKRDFDPNDYDFDKFVTKESLESADLDVKKTVIAVLNRMIRNLE